MIRLDGCRPWLSRMCGGLGRCARVAGPRPVPGGCAPASSVEPLTALRAMAQDHTLSQGRAAARRPSPRPTPHRPARYRPAHVSLVSSPRIPAATAPSRNANGCGSSGGTPRPGSRQDHSTHETCRLRRELWQFVMVCDARWPSGGVGMARPLPASTRSLKVIRSHADRGETCMVPYHFGDQGTVAGAGVLASLQKSHPPMSIVGLRAGAARREPPRAVCRPCFTSPRRSRRRRAGEAGP